MPRALKKSSPAPPSVQPTFSPSSTTSGLFSCGDDGDTGDNRPPEVHAAFEGEGGSGGGRRVSRDVVIGAGPIIVTAGRRAGTESAVTSLLLCCIGSTLLLPCGGPLSTACAPSARVWLTSDDLFRTGVTAGMKTGAKPPGAFPLNDVSFEPGNATDGPAPAPSFRLVFQAEARGIGALSSRTILLPRMVSKGLELTVLGGAVTGLFGSKPASLLNSAWSSRDNSASDTRSSGSQYCG